METTIAFEISNFKLDLIQNLNLKQIKSTDQMIEVIKEFRSELAEKIQELEDNSTQDDFDVERQIAILIRQSQYLYALQNKNKGELIDLLTELCDDFGSSEVLSWYQQSNN